jgi:hypothetical protein
MPITPHSVQNPHAESVLRDPYVERRFCGFYLKLELNPPFRRLAARESAAAGHASGPLQSPRWNFQEELGMKRLGWVLIILLSTSPAWCAKKITLAELEQMLNTLRDQKKTDAEAANALKQVELTEELTRAKMNSFATLVAGPLSTEQIYVLEARSATLPPPASDLPATPVPDAAAQKAILDKAADYVSKTYSQLPSLTAAKTTVRFQDNVEAAAPSSGLQGGAKDISVGSSFVSPFQYIHYINSTESAVTSQHGAEQPATEKDKTPWGANKMITITDPDPSLTVVFSEAQDSGTIKFLRWQTVNGRPAAVFTFEVPKKKAHYPVDVCCFPDVDAVGKANFSSAALGGGGVSGNFQTATSWHPYKANVPFHGQLFIDPDTGIVVRMATFADLKQTEVVHQADTRIDYAPVAIDGKPLVVPAKTYLATEVVPNGDSGSAGKYSVRRTLFTSEYKNYQAAK